MSRWPYPGLRPFRRDETDIFFGREEQTDQLLEKLGQSRFLAVVGPSGCGKSSLVRAGMIAALERGFLASAGGRWRVADMRPGDRPRETLATALMDKAALGAEQAGEADPAAWLNATVRRVQRGPKGLLEVLCATPLPDRTNLLVLVDQFEEIFRYRQQVNLDEADAFVALLLTTAVQREVPVYVVITMRSDFLGDCALFEGLPEAINESQYLTPRLSRDQRHEAIVRPADQFAGTVEPALVNGLLNDMGPDPDQLPLMQHVLMRMWTRASDAVKSPSAELNIATSAGAVGDQRGKVTLALADYQAVGGLAKALSNHADKAFGELNDEQKRIAEVLFRCLSERGTGQRDTRRPVHLGVVATVAGVGPEQVAEVVEVFRLPSRSFITPPVGKPLYPETILDISHESLIRQWERLKEWVEQEASSAETYRFLEQTARLWGGRKAALWGTPDLENALEWKAREKPSPDWAKRYGSDFELAMQFLDASEQKRKADEAAVEAARQRELKRAQRQAGVALLGLVIAAIIAGWAFWERGKAEKARKEVLETFVTHASLLARNEDYAAARKVLEQSRALDKDIPATRRHARNLLARFGEILGGEARQVYEGAGAPLFAVAVSPDGRLLAAVGESGTVVLFDAESGALRQHLEGHEDTVKDVVFHPQGAWLASAGNDRQIIRWSLPSGDAPAAQLQAWEAPAQVWSLAVSPDGRLLASGGGDNDISLWDAETGELVRRLKGHGGAIAEVAGLAFSPSGTLLASASYDDTARVWEVKTGETLQVLKGHNGAVTGVAFSPDGKRIATSGRDKRLILWAVESGQRLQVFTGHQNFVFGLGFVARHPHGDTGTVGGEGDAPLLVSASFDRTLRVWDTDSGVTLRVLQGRGTMTDIAVHAARGAGQGMQAFSASNDGTVRRWDIAPLPHQRLVDVPGSPQSAAIAPDGKIVAVGFNSGALRLYSLPEMRMVGEEQKAHGNMVHRLSFNADGTLLASASFDDTAKLWAVAPEGTFTARQTFRGHRKSVHGLAFSPDGMTLATASYDGRVGLFTVGTEEKRFIYAHEGDVASVAFDDSGTRLLSVGVNDKTARLWDLTRDLPTRIKAFPKAPDKLLWATLSPDGESMASVGREFVVRVYSTPDTRLRHRLVGHEQTVYRAVFSPDGHQLASVSTDATVRLWDLDTGGELFTLRLPTNRYPPVPMWDFDFRCTTKQAGGDCWIAVPLTRGKLVIYYLGQIYD